MSQNSLFERYDIVGDNTKSFLQKFKNILGINATVLITGETGTGKELIARWIHFNDAKRRDKPFVKITIPNIGENIFESEIFGYERGAFTGAVSSKKGLVEVADEGTVFLDEIENATPSIQSKLLQLLEDRIFRKVGDTTYRKTDARFIIATNKDLYKETLSNTFRSDLYYRIAVLEINIPPLRERGRDILQIANHYISVFSDETGIRVNDIGESEYNLMKQYTWPGNVRELKNFIEKAVIFAEDSHINQTMLPKSNNESSLYEENLDYKAFMNKYESDLIKKAVEKSNGNINDAAKLMGMSVPFVYKKIKEYNIVF